MRRLHLPDIEELIEKITPTEHRGTWLRRLHLQNREELIEKITPIGHRGTN